MSERGYELDLTKVRSEGKQEVSRLCYSVRRWGEAMSLAGPGEFEVYRISRTPPGSTHFLPDAAELAKILVGSDDDVEGFAILVRRRSRDRSGILSSSSEIPRIEASLFEMGTTGGCDSRLQSGFPRSGDEIFGVGTKFRNQRVK